eukprot:superscaffoldBa00001897_g12437
MEVAFCAKEVSGHATSMLASLSLQREQAQFCDCVVRQRQSPGQLYPAHRCVLAASSPVWASILSSTGALVELQAPCLSDSVLELLLDYIYTGVLPYPCSQQKYSNLLSAARHLQMDELQEALEAWQQTEDSGSPSQCASLSSSPSSLCCGAVPVICHSSRAAMLQLAEVSTMPPYPGYQASASSCSRAPVSRSTSTDNDSIVEDDSDTGSDSLFEDLSPKGEAKKEHSYSSWCTDEIDGQDSHNLYGPKTDWYPNSHRAEKITKDTASWQHEKDSDYSDTAMTDKRHSADVCLPASASPESSWDNASDCQTSRELEKISDTEIAEPHIAFTKPVDSNMSDPTYSVAGQSYHGHLHYHCLSQEDTYFTHRDSDHNHSNPGHPVHLNCDHSDQSSDEDEAGTFASPGHSRQRKHFATGTTDQVLLLDISNKPAELLVSYKHRPGEGEKGVGKQDTNGTEVGNNDREQQSETTFVAGVGKGEIGVQFETDSFDEAKTKFGCSLCDRSFSQRGSLNRHVRSHLGVRPFPCPRCPMTFSRQYRVTEHMRVHERCAPGNDFQKHPAS